MNCDTIDMIWRTSTVSTEFINESEHSLNCVKRSIQRKKVVIQSNGMKCQYLNQTLTQWTIQFHPKFDELIPKFQKISASYKANDKTKPKQMWTHCFGGLDELKGRKCVILSLASLCLSTQSQGDFSRSFVFRFTLNEHCWVYTFIPWKKIRSMVPAAFIFNGCCCGYNMFVLRCGEMIWKKYTHSGSIEFKRMNFSVYIWAYLVSKVKKKQLTATREKAPIYNIFTIVDRVEQQPAESTVCGLPFVHLMRWQNIRKWMLSIACEFYVLLSSLLLPFECWFCKQTQRYRYTLSRHSRLHAYIHLSYIIVCIASTLKVRTMRFIRR